MENPSPFSEWPREKLEEQVIKGLKHIKALRKQNTELLEAAHELETRLANQMQMASELAEENDRLQSKSKTSGFTIGNIGKTITSMITGSHGSLILDSNTSSISIDPIRMDESPEVISLRSRLKNIQDEIDESRRNETTVREFAESLQKRIEQREAVFAKISSDNDIQKKENHRLQQHLNETLTKVEGLDATIERLEKELLEAQSLTAHGPELAVMSTNLQNLAAKHSELVEQHELLKSETIEARVAREETERRNEQLKESLKKATRANKDKDDEIQALKQRLVDACDERGQIGQQFDGVRELVALREREIADLKAQLKELSERLDSGRGSVAVEAKVAQMQRMLERSNELYADMQERAAKDSARVRELEAQLHSAKSLGRPICSVETPSGEYVICENGRWFREHSSAKNVPKIAPGCACRDQETQTEKSPNDEYVKALVVKYFLAEGKARHQMVPVILDVLGVNSGERHAIMNRPRGGLSLFGS